MYWDEGAQRRNEAVKTNKPQVLTLLLQKRLPSELKDSRIGYLQVASLNGVTLAYIHTVAQHEILNELLAVDAEIAFPIKWEAIRHLERHHFLLFCRLDNQGVVFFIDSNTDMRGKSKQHDDVFTNPDGILLSEERDPRCIVHTR